VDRGSIPIHDVSPFIAQRHVANQQPTITPIYPPYAGFTFHRLPTSNGRPPLADVLRKIIRMNQGTQAPAQYVLRGLPVKFQERTVDEVTRAVRLHATCIDFNRIDDK